jgi:hypothetical protein
MSLVQVALLGAVIGVPLGYAMQRTNLYFNRDEVKWQSLSYSTYCAWCY